jgi:hypothetical protein
VNRLFLTKGSQLETLGLNITIAVNEIISDDGIIESFPRNKEASAGQSGQSGGFLQIQAKRGSGKLHIFARGESVAQEIFCLG